MTNLDTHPEQQPADPARRGALKALLGGAAGLGLTSLGLGASEAQADVGWEGKKAPLIKVTKDARKEQADARKEQEEARKEREEARKNASDELNIFVDKVQSKNPNVPRSTIVSLLKKKYPKYAWHLIE